jgi:phenylalanyl-tRNA synthetase alpha chain
LTKRIADLRAEAAAAVAAARDSHSLEQARIKYLGRRAELTSLLRQVAQLPPPDRAAVGSAGNHAKRSLEEAIERRSQELSALELEQRFEHDTFDVTLPADPAPGLGRLHLITQTWREIEDVFIGLGFNVAEGPEIETVYYNFDALNTPRTHPSRLLSDTFYVQPAGDIFDPNTLLLRVHTSPVQVRAMELHPPALHHRSRAGLPS